MMNTTAAHRARGLAAVAAAATGRPIADFLPQPRSAASLLLEATRAQRTAPVLPKFTASPRAMTAAEILADRSTSLEVRCITAWKNDAAIRSEFGSLPIFVAYTRAAETGKAWVCSGYKVETFRAVDFATGA